MRFRPLAAAASVGIAVIAGACSNTDDLGSEGLTPTTVVDGAAADQGINPEPVDASDSIETLTTAASSTDVCEVVAAMRSPLPTSGNADQLITAYGLLANLVASSVAIVPDDPEFPTLRADWEALIDVTRSAHQALEQADGVTSDAVFVSALRSDVANRSLETIERYDRVRCGDVSTP